MRGKKRGVCNFWKEGKKLELNLLFLERTKESGFWTVKTNYNEIKKHGYYNNIYYIFLLVLQNFSKLEDFKIKYKKNIKI